MNATTDAEILTGLVEAAPDALIVVDDEGRIVLWNAEAETMFGWRRDEILGHRIEDLVPERFRRAHVAHRAEYGDAPQSRPMSARRDLVALHRSGKEFPVDIALSPLATRFGQFTVASVRDATERCRTEDKLRYLSGHDSLTGIYNRHAFDEERARLTRGRRFPLSIVMVDLDGLKEINDTLGHGAGDRLLRNAAGVLMHAFRAEDTVARLGGDEFAALLPATGKRAATAAKGRVEELVQRHNERARGPALRVSIGVATAANGRAVSQCLREADAAMYREKIQHRGAHRGTGRREPRGRESTHAAGRGASPARC